MEERVRRTDRHRVNANAINSNMEMAPVAHVLPSTDDDTDYEDNYRQAEPHPHHRNYQPPAYQPYQDAPQHPVYRPGYDQPHQASYDPQYAYAQPAQGYNNLPPIKVVVNASNLSNASSDSRASSKSASKSTAKSISKADAQAQAIAVAVAAGYVPLRDGVSTFDGSIGGYIGITIITTLLTIVTLGLCTPWAMCKSLRWKTNHTIVEGHRLHFTGTGMGLFNRWLLWMLLTIVTLGFYGFIVGLKLEQWRTAHTVFA